MKLHRPFIAVAALAVCLTWCVSCRTTAPLPPADLSAPGWQLHQGQALWKPTKNRPELAGDLLLATNASGDYFIQFTKIPFTLASAQVMNGAWQIQFGDGHHSWRGKGAPPKRFAWFKLPAALAGTTPAAPWTFTRRADDSWRLENSRTGEVLEGVFFP